MITFLILRKCIVYFMFRLMYNWLNLRYFLVFRMLPQVILSVFVILNCSAALPLVWPEYGYRPRSVPPTLSHDTAVVELVPGGESMVSGDLILVPDHNTGTVRITASIFYGILIKQSGAMDFILNGDKVLLKKLFPTMNI